MAHFGYPWHLEVLASAQMKTNVWVDLSGWRPRYVPPEVTREARTRLRDRFVWGSDYPMFDPGAMLAEVDDYGLGDAQEDVLKNNAARLLNLPT
jgi:predicted TIM-barrel fold metal-dependent hydrolase